MKKAFVFDFDDTLATTECSIRVVRKSPKLQRYKLTPEQFLTYELRHDEEFDFSEFCSKEFIHNANPTFLMNLAQEVYAEDHAVYVLTARDDGVAEAIAEFLLKHNVKPINIFCVGSRDEKLDIATEKKKVLSTLTQAFDIVYFYDDHPENCNLARDIGSGIKVYCYMGIEK